jgi:hypothetical protein
MTFTNDELQAMNKTTAGKGFKPTRKADRPSTLTQPETTAQSTAIPQARTNALALSTQNHDAMSALQGAGLQNAAAYVHRKTLERNSVVDKVSDAIAYLSDPDLLESDIMSAAAAKVAARSGAWGYTEPEVDFDTLFSLPASSHKKMLTGL